MQPTVVVAVEEVLAPRVGGPRARGRRATPHRPRSGPAGCRRTRAAHPAAGHDGGRVGGWCVPLARGDRRRRDPSVVTPLGCQTQDMTRTDLRTAIAERPVVLDGGLATLLEARPRPLERPVVGPAAARRSSEPSSGAHREFFTAGAEVATTASYQVSFQGFGAEGADRDEVERLLRRSVELAAAARDARRARRAGWPPRWARTARCWPTARSTAGDYDLDVAGLRAFHRPRLDVLARPSGGHADLLAIEDDPVPGRGRGRARRARRHRRPCVAVPVGRWTAAPAPASRIAEAFAMAADVAEVVAVGRQLLLARRRRAAVPLAGAHGPLVAYPNSGQGWNAATRPWEGRSAFDAGRRRRVVARRRAPGRRVLPRRPRRRSPPCRATPQHHPLRAHAVSTTSRWVARVIAT